MGYLEIVKKALAAKDILNAFNAKALTPRLVPGAWIEWKSPLFGVCSGQVGLVDGDKVLITDHQITHDYHGPGLIPIEWVVRVL